MCSCIEKSVLLSEGKIDEEPHENTTLSEEVKQHVFSHGEVLSFSVEAENFITSSENVVLFMWSHLFFLH